MGEPEYGRCYTVSEITSLIRGLLEEQFPQLTIEGEVSNFRPSSTGHYYFSLKDREAIISVVMFRNRLSTLAFALEDGLLVRATGSLSVYPKRGSYQLICETLVKSGQGELLALLEERKRRLAAEGLFDPARKKPLPLFPSRVAVVTSPTGAALRDILRVLKRRNIGIDLVILPAPVQGEAAAQIMAERIRAANRFRLGEVIIVGRGGGSLEDLLPFYEEVLVRAIAESEIPVISAVGHEIDFTLTDLVADVRAPTPSAAAELVSASRMELTRRVAEAKNSLLDTMLGRLERIKLLASQFTPDNLERHFHQLIQPLFMSLDEARGALESGMKDLLTETRHRLSLLANLLESRSPLEVLKRGYAVVIQRKTGKALTSTQPVDLGDDLHIRLHQGSLEAEVKEKNS